MKLVISSTHVFFYFLLLSLISTAAIGQVKVRIIFGTTSNSCEGFGLCRMYVDDGEMDELTDASAELKIIPDGVELTILKSSMKPDLMERHLGTYTFVQSESFQVPSEVCAELESSPVRISIGEYEIVDKDERSFVVRFIDSHINDRRY
jgi:hypothetical protein